MIEAVDQKARDAISRIEGKQDAHERECVQVRRATEQWQQSATRTLSEMRAEIAQQAREIKTVISDHAKSDMEFQELISTKMDFRSDGWNKFVIRILLAVTGGLFTITGAMVWFYIVQGHGHP